MWTHTWMSFTSHTFTSLPLVHTPNLDFLRQRLWLGFLLVRESPHSGNLHISRLPNSNFSGFPNSADSWFHGFADSWLRVFTGLRLQELRRFKALDLHRFATLELRSFKIPDLRKFVTSELRRFKVPDLRRFKIPENSFQEFRRTRCFEGDRFSWIPQHYPLEEAGWLRRSDSTKILVFQLKTSPSERRSGHASSGNLATVESRRVLETAPLAPINRELQL
jgi:hypothetical protein